MARDQGRAWLDHLPMVLLSLHSSIREDSNTCPAELLFGAPLRLPGQLLPDPEPSATPGTEFVADLRRSLLSAAPMPVRYHGHQSTHVPAALAGADHVFVRVDAVRAPLCHPYEGPFRVLESGHKTFKLDRAGKPWVVSIDRLKAVPKLFPLPGLPRAISPPRSPSSLPPTLPVSPAPLFPLAPPMDLAAAEDEPLFGADADPGVFPAGVAPLAPVSPTYRTRFGRSVRPPDRYGDSVVGDAVDDIFES